MSRPSHRFVYLLLLLCPGLAGGRPALAADSQAENAAGASAKPDPLVLSRIIDREIEQRLEAEKIPLSPPADDAEFYRRVTLDITGIIPAADKVKAFLDSKDPDKRAKAIDELLASPRYGQHLADIWQSILFTRTTDNRRLQPTALIEWLTKRFNDNQSWDKMVTELLTASGKQDQNGAVSFFLSNPSVDKMTDITTRAFLGVQLQCAQCHNHPFTNWKQDEYWGMAAFFMKVRPDGNVRQAVQQGNSPGISEVTSVRRGRLPEGGRVLPPKFLQGERAKVNSSEPYRPVLARWLTSANNPYFAKAMTNRMWSQFMGRGFVNPIDDMHEGNEPSHPVLLAVMSEHFKSSGFDLKYLVRAICNSKTYQRTSKPVPGNEESGALFGHMTVKVMSPEQLFDSLSQVAGRMEPGRDRPRGAGRFVGNSRAAFVAFFKTEEGADPTEYQAGIPQVLRLMNSGQLNNPALLNQVVRSGKSDKEIIEHLYLATLSRRPTSAELERKLAYVEARKGSISKAYGDILWALLNCSEFTLNH